MALQTPAPCAGCSKISFPVDMRQCPRCFIGSNRTICSCCTMCAACDCATPSRRRRLNDRSPAWATSLDASWGQVDPFCVDGSVVPHADRQLVQEPYRKGVEKSPAPHLGKHFQRTPRMGIAPGKIFEPPKRTAPRQVIDVDNAIAATNPTCSLSEPGPATDSSSLIWSSALDALTGRKSWQSVLDIWSK
jgi:hypothetical protein